MKAAGSPKKLLVHVTEDCRLSLIFVSSKLAAEQTVPSVLIRKIISIIFVYFHTLHVTEI
jgi:hypothetical protein